MVENRILYVGIQESMQHIFRSGERDTSLRLVESRILYVGK